MSVDASDVQGLLLGSNVAGVSLAWGDVAVLSGVGAVTLVTAYNGAESSAAEKAAGIVLAPSGAGEFVLWQWLGRVWFPPGSLIPGELYVSNPAGGRPVTKSSMIGTNLWCRNLGAARSDRELIVAPGIVQQL